MVLGGEEGLVCEVCIDGNMSEFKYLGFVLDESVTDEAEYRRKVEGSREGCKCYKVSG